MIPADRALCAVAAEAYASAPDWQGGDAFAIRRDIGGTAIIAFRGSRSLADWFVDFRALPHASTVHAAIGEVHAGFLADVAAVADRILADLPEPFVLTGHSKGGAEALVFAAWAISAGRKPLAVTTFGAPRPGALGGLLQGFRGTSWRHRDDPVCLAPPWLPHPRPVVQLGDPEYEIDVADHFLERYAAALAA